jgi:hypothetical protein
MKAKVDIKSTLEKIATAVFIEKDLNKAKEIFRSHIETSGINEKDKKTILRNIDLVKNKYKLDSYLVNSLLHYEGHGTSQLKENIAEQKLRSLIRNIINEELNEYGMDSGGQDMTWGMYNRQDSKKNSSNEDFIKKGYYDYYEDISFNTPPYDFGKNKYYGGADLAKLWQLGWKQAEAEDKGIEMEDDDFEPRRDDSDDQSSDFYNVNL